MKAELRFGLLTFAAGLSLGSQALAQAIPQNVQQAAPQTAPPATPQTTAPAPTNGPTRDTVGPRELQNFSLGGTVTTPAETRPATAAPASGANGGTAGAPPATTPSAGPPVARRDIARTGPIAARPQAPATAAPQPSAPSFTPDLTASATPPATTAAPPAPAPNPSFTAEPGAGSAEFAPSHGTSMLPWLLAVLLLGGGLAFLLWRRRPREVLAGGPAVDSYAPPEPVAPPPVMPRAAPAPAPVPAPAPFPAPPASTGFVPAATPAPAAPAASTTVRAFASAPVAPPQPVGLVSTRLRPWLDITMVPTACRIDDQQVAFEFEIDIFNSGGAPARDIHVVATLINAGPAQEQEIAAFIAKGTTQGEPLPPIPPLQRITFRTALAADRANLQLFEAAGRQLFVPVLAFNALYRWSGGTGQSAGSYLLGRDTGAEKLAPLRAQSRPQAFGGLGARPLPTAVRT